MTKKLEKQFDFKEDIKKRKSNRLGELADWITTISCSGTLLIVAFYNSTPSVYENVRENIKYLFN